MHTEIQTEIEDRDARLPEPSVARVKERLRLEANENLDLLPQDFFARRSEVEITIVMLSYRRLDRTINAIKSLRENVKIPFNLLLVDNDSGPMAREKLKEISAAYDFIELVLLNENLGCAGGRDYAMQRAQTRYVMLIDNDIEVFPGAVEHLLHCLETNPQALAATGRVIFPDGSIHLCGGGYLIENGVLNFELFGFGRKFDDWTGASGPCQWVPGCLTLLRREALIDNPYDLGMRNYYEDLEWCYRLNRSGDGVFRRVVESVAMHYHETKDPNLTLPVKEKREAAMKYIATIAYFYKIHGLVIPNIFTYVPELGTQSSHNDRLSARLFLTLTNTYGTDWILEKWNGGELTPLFSGGIGDEKAHEQCKRKIFELEKNVAGLTKSLEDIYQSKHWMLFDRYWRIKKSISNLFSGGKD